MRTFYLPFLIVILAFQFKCQGQDFIYGDVSLKELEAEEHPVYENATAAILYKEHFYTYGFSRESGMYIEHTVYKRIKIYSKEGLSYGENTFAILSTKGYYDKLLSLKGITHNLENGEHIEIELDKDGQYKDKLDDVIQLQKFALPGVKVGSVIELKYSTRSGANIFIPKVNFQEDIPVDRVEFDFEAPHTFIFSLHTWGNRDIFPNVSKRTIEDSNPLKFRDQWNGKNYEYLMFFNCMNISLDSLAPFEAESFMDSPVNYRSSLKLELAYTQISNKILESYSRTWEDVSDYFYNHQYFGDRQRATLYFKKYARQATREDLTVNAKIDRIYKMVVDRMDWNNQIGCYTSQTLTKAYEDGEGNAAEINLILCELLNEVGVEAYPVLLTTRSQGYYPSPTKQGLDYVIVAVRVDDSFLLLDATFKEGKKGMLPERAINYIGRIIGKDGETEPVSLMPQRVSYAIKTASVSLNSTGGIEAACKTQSSRYVAIANRQKFTRVGHEVYVQELASSMNGEISEYNNSGLEPSASSYTEQFQYENSSAVDVINEEIYIDPLLFFEHENIPFQEENRNSAIDLIYPKQESITLKIKIPEGYSVKLLPLSKEYFLPRNEGSYSFKITQNEQEIVVKSNFGYKHMHYETAAFPYFKEMYRSRFQAESQKIVLIKK